MAALGGCREQPVATAGLTQDFHEVVVLRGEPSELSSEVRVVIRELPLADGVHGSTGNQLWPAGNVLAREFLRHPLLVKDRFILDLGAGCGLAGLVAASLGARRVLLTDCDSETVENLQHNILANSHLWERDLGDWKVGGGQCEVQAEALDWRTSGSDSRGQEAADLVISSDTVYGHFGDDLARCALSHLSTSGSVILVAPQDRQTGVPAFLDRMKSAGYTVAQTSLLDEHGEGFLLFDLTRRCP